MLKDLANQVKVSKYSKLSNALSQPKMAKDEISRTCKYITFRKQKRLYNVIKIRLLKWRDYAGLSGCCGSSIVKSCPTLCDPTDCGTPGFPVLHCLPESAQTHIHWVDDAIQSSHPLSPPSPPALNLSHGLGLPGSGPHSPFLSFINLIFLCVSFST